MDWLAYINTDGENIYLGKIKEVSFVDKIETDEKWKDQPHSIVRVERPKRSDDFTSPISIKGSQNKIVCTHPNDN